MKLHLPNTLRKALLAVLAGTTYYSTAEAGCMHAGVSPTIYTDFGQNMGRYSVYQVNELLSTITRENGILIPYTTGAEPGKLEHKMISFEGMNNDGAFTAVGYNYTATVAHNGCPNPSFTPRYIGDNQAIHYQGVEYRSSENKAFLLQPGIDYKVTRSSKIFTDITASGVFDVTEYLRSGHQVTELVHYRAGAGSQEVADFEGHTHGVAGGYAYITGGVVATLGFNYANSYNYETGEGPVDGRGIIDDPYTISVHGIQDYGPGGAGQPTPDNPKVYLLPFVSRGGDSGSPVWAWDAVDEEYKLISCHQARGGDNSYSRGASSWTIATMESFNKDVDMEAAGNTVHMSGAVYVADKSKTISDSTNNVSTTTQYGSITGGEGFETVYFCGVGSNLTTQETVYTWLSLADQKNVQNWYSYGNTYFNANGNGSGKQMHLGDLFNTENIVFSASGDERNNIYLDGDVDTGIGYVQFTPGEGATEGQNVKFYLLSDGSVADGKDGAARNYMLNSAGYIVDKGAELHIQVSNTQWDAAHSDYYYREWRKQGAGDMYIEGTGNNEVFLNLGGKGTTYLDEKDGYAAYNVLINNGATVNFGGDIKQIARDVTFGNGGGYLEFSGMGDFTWESGANNHVSQDGFTINALTQDATLINSEGTATLHYVTPGNTTFLGSFQDTENSHLNIIYEGGGTWTLNSIHTKLHAGSKFTVADGTVELVGTNTVHALGSIEGKAGTRYSHPDDWHYADSEMDVTVKSGATFRLGSHARLTGDVTVESGGTLEIAEGVKHQYEYIEGWLIAEDTYDPFYRAFYGLKGDVTLAENSTLRFNFSSGTDAENVYGGNISGSGNVDMQLGGSGATLVLSGTNDFTGTKHLAGGGLVAEAYTALGNTADNKWHVAEDAFIAVKGIDGNAALEHIDGDSTGVLALTQDQAQQVNLNGTHHESMFVGALAGQVIQYGEAPVTSGSRIVYTKDALETVTLNGNKYWQLGGGGGELVVNFLLDDPDSQLVLGNEYTTGTVTLTNAWNRIGSIFFAGKVTLNYTSEEALGGSKISLDYTNRVAGSPSIVSSLTRHSSGAMMLDGMEDINVDLTDHKELFLGAEGYVDYRGTITPDGGAYRFGGITGTLVLNNALVNQADEQTNLIVDAQTYSGGTLALAAKATITGDVTVMGWDATRPGVSGGDIALRLDVDDAIASARSVTLKEGGILDVNGTSQTLHRFNMEAGSLLTDTSAAWNGTVTLNVQSGETSELRGGVEVNTLVKDGAGSLLLAGDNAYGTLLINEGRVDLLNGNSMSASGITMVETNGILNLAGGFDVTGSVAFAGGKALVTNKSLNGSIMVGTDGDGRPQTGTLEQVSANLSTRINSAVEVAQGSTLNLKGSNGTFILTATDINEAGGTIALDGHYLTINRGGEDPVNVGGTISLKGYTSGNDRATLYSDGSANNMVRNINELHIAGGNAAIEEASWNTIWNIHSLTGSGDLLWNSHTSHWFSSQLYLDGANDYAGKFTAQRTNGGSSDRKYQAYVELSHDLAAQNMDVDIKGQNDNNYMSLAINTDNATMKSLSGNQYAVLYAGVANPGTDQEHEQAGEKPLNEQPVSTRRATLTITGTGHTFSGNVSGQDRYIGYETKEDGSQVQVADVTNAGISIVMDGRGMQTFNGQHIRFNSVTVNSGVLELDTADLTIKEDVTITRGAELRLSQAYALDSGKTLTVLANESSPTALLSGGLTLNGGTLTFSAEGLSDSAPALSIGSLSGSSVTLNFTETHAFTSDVQYHLADQDWSHIHITDATEGLTYLTASYQTDANGLRVSFTTKAGNLIWGGTDGEHDWSSSAFGPSGRVPTSDQTAVFNDAAPNHHVNITNNVKVAGLVFDAAGDYELASDNDSIVTAGSVVQSGSGTTILTEAVRVGTDQSRGTVTVTNGELRVTNEAVLRNVDTITGGGTLGVDFGEGNRGTVDALFVPGSSVGSLHVVSGTFDAYGIPCYAGLLLDAGAGYTVGAEQTLAYVQAGQGEGGSPAMLNLGKRKLTAAMVVMQGDLNISGSGGELHADITGGHTITTSGTVTLRGSNFDGNLHVQSGTLSLYDGANTHVAGITMDADTTLYLGISTGLEGGATIHMGNNASLQMENGAGGSHIVNANIVMDGSSASLYGTLNGNSTVVRGSIAGHGTLFLKAQSSFWNNSWSIESLLQDGKGGALALSSDGNVTLSGANTYSGGTTITGNRLTTNNERALGTGTLNMTAGELVLKKDLTIGGLSGRETASINLGSKLLTVDSADDTRFSGEISNGSIAKLGSGTLEIEVGGELDNISVGGGTLALGDCALTGNLSVAAGTTLDFTGDMLRLSHAVDNAGTFRFRTSGTSIEIENGSGFDIHTDGYLDVNGNKADNGFAQGLTIQVFENTGDGQIVGIAPEVAYMGDTLTLDLATGVASRGGSNSAYTVRMGTVVYDDAFAAAPGAKAVESFNLASADPFAPATLQLNQGLANGVTILSTGLGGNVGIGEGVTLNQSQLDAQVRTTLTGTGTYALAQGAWKLPSNVVLGDKNSWTGVVRVSNFADNGVNFANLANANSWVEVYGMRSGYLAQWNGGNLSTNLILTDNPDVGYAMFMNNGSGKAERPVMTVSGKWKGTGTVRNGNTGQTLNLDLKFTGDISGWFGKYEQTGSSSILYFAAKDDMVVNASFANTGSGYYNMVVDTNTTFNGTIENAQMFTVKSDATATLAGADKVMDAITIEETATLVNQGNTTLTGTVANSGTINNLSGANLELGDSATSVGSITNAGTLTLGAKLIEGNITNNGDIIISSLLWEQASGYEDARGNKTPSGNGFATNSLSVYDSGVTIEGEGHIYYGGNDVTQEVMSTGAIQSAINHGTYYIKTTDDAVTYSSIVSASENHLEYIHFKTDAGASLRVDSSDGLPHLRTSQVVVNDLFDGTATLSMEDGSTLVVDSSCLARVAATANSSITLQLDATTPDTHMWLLGGFAPSGATVNVTGSGVLDLDTNQYNIATLNISGAAVLSSFEGKGGSFSGRTDVNITQGGRLQLAKVDALGWASNLTKSINIAGDDTAVSALELGFRQTLSGTTAINMNGNAVIRAMEGYTGSGENLPMLDAYSNTPQITATGTGNVVAVPLRMRTDFTFDVAANGELTLAGGTASGYRGHNVVKNGAGKLIFDELQVNFGEHTYTGALNINAGSVEVKTDATFATVNAASALAITGGTTTINAYTGNNGSSLSVEQGASLIFNGTTELAAPITNNGNLSFASGSSVTLNGTFDHGNGTYLDLDTGVSAENGNGLLSGAYVVVSSGSGAHSVAGTVAVTYNSQQYTLHDDGKAYQSFDDSIYHVRNGSANYSRAVASAESITSVDLSNGATLNMQATLAGGVTISSSGGTVVIGDGVVLSRDDLHASVATTVNGTGTYSLNVAEGTSRGENVSFGNDWHGAIRLYGTATENLDLNSVARQGAGYAPLELAGVTASLATGQINPDLVLTNTVGGPLALTVSNAGNFTFAGAISGSGIMANASGGNTVFAFSGADVSDWNGSIQNSSGNLTVNISGMESGGAMGAALVGVNAVSYTGATVQDTYTVSSLQTNDGGTSLTGTNGTLVVDTLTGGGALTVNGSVELAGGEYEGSTITVDTDATLHLNGVQAHGAVLSGAGTVKLAADQVTVAGVTASGRIEAEGEGSHTLEIAGTGGVSSASIGANVDLVMSGTGTQEFNGSLNDFNGAVDVLSGKLTFGQAVDISSLTMKGGEIGLAAGSSLSSVRVASGAQASINAQNGTIALDHAIMNSGALTLAGTIDASKLEMQTRDNGYIAVGADSPTENGSGFATVQNAVEVVRNVVAGSLNVENAYVTRDGKTVQLSSDGWARFDTGDATNYDTYYLRDNDIANLSVTQIQNAAAGHATLNKIVFDNMEASVNLVVDTDTSLSLFKVNEDCTANLNLAESGRINLPSGYRGVEGFVKLSGEGTYSITNTNSLGKGVSLADGWQGTMELNGTGNALDLARRGGLWAGVDAASSSTVRLNGWASALTDTGWTTDAHVELTGDGLTVQGSALTGDTAPEYAFNGNVSGEGSITNSRAGAATFTFADVQGWTGSFIGTAGESTLNFNTDSVAASIAANGGKVAVMLNGSGMGCTVSGTMDKTESGALDVCLLNHAHFTGSANVSSLFVNESTTAAIYSDFTTGNISSSGFIMVVEGSLTVTEGIEMLASTIDNEGGIIAFTKSGTVVNLLAGGDFDSTASSYKDINETISEKGNGFHIGGNVQIISNGNGGSITGCENVTVKYDGLSYQLLETGELYNADDIHTYYIHTGTVAYSSVKDAEGLVGLHLDSTLKPDASATLNLDANLASTVTNGIISDGGTISIGQGVTLEAASLHAHGATKLSGQGTYDLGSGASTLGVNVSLNNDWRGIVKISDVDMKPFRFASFGNAYSTVELNGLSGWWALNSDQNFAGKLILDKDTEHPEKAAFKLTDASSNREYTIGGGISGAGDYVIAYPSNKGISATTHTIEGDVEHWTGSFIDAVEQAGTKNVTTLKFQNNTKDANGIVNIGAGILDQRKGRSDHEFNVSVAANQGSVHMSGDIEGIDKLTFDPSSNGRSLTIDSLKTNDDNGTTLEFKDSGVAGTIAVNSLSGSGTLTLHNNNKSSGLANFAINGGDYTGESIVFNAMKAGYSGGARCVLLTLGDGNVAKDAVIHTTIDKNGGGVVNIGIAVNADTVRVGGLNDTITSMAATCVYSLVSGNPTSHTGANATGFESDGSIRTLVIGGNGGTSKAKVGANLNITMNSAGHTQAFTGDMAAFSGAIDVQAGTLDITSTGAVSLHAVNVEEGASLVLAATSATTMAQTIINNGNLTIGGTFVLDAMDISDASKFEDGEASEHNGFLVGGPSIQVVSGNSATLAQGGVTMTYKGEQGSFDAATGRASFAGTGQTHYETFYVNSADTAESLAHAKEASGGALDTVRLTDGTTLNMDLADGTLNTVQVSSGASATLHVSKNVTLSSVTGLENGQTLAVTGAEGGRLTMAVGTDTAIGGTLEVRDGGYVVLGNANAFGSHSNKVVIGKGGTVDVNGKSDAKYVYTLDGGFLTNTGSSLPDNWAQTSGLVLTDDSSIGGSTADFRILSGNFAANSVKLDGHILTKVGSNMIGFVNTTFNEGTLRVEQGKLDFDSGNRKNNDVLNGTRIVLADAQAGAADKMIGSVHVEGSAEITAEQSAQASVQINIRDNAALSVGAEQDRNLKLSGTVSGGDSTTIHKTGAGSVELSGNLQNFSGSIDAQGGILELLNQNSLAVQDVTIADGATVSAYTGTEKLDEYESTLTISGTLAAKGANGKLNANVVMEKGSTLDVRGTGGAGLLMGSEVALNKGMTLSDYTSEWASWEVGTKYTLFTGVDGLDIGNGVTTGTMDYTQWVDASEYFTNIEESNRYFLCYGGAPDQNQNAVGVLSSVNDGSNVGMVYIMTVPEPTTSTLSLLALAALAARRRRK